ncbi:MAG: PD-(D/E)XK nuclease family protein, partial [Pontibacter sp.]|nr:PD-(D/E)XK nuclease family protein [Pontibacter sp.]
FGTIVHQVLEDFFRPFEQSGEPILAEHVAQMLKVLPEKVKTEFSKVTLGAKPERGMNYLLYKVAVEVLNKYLLKLKDSDELPLYVLRLEQTLAATLPVQVGNEVVQVRIAGKADRIDLTGHELRVIDYKTGKVEQNQLRVKDEDLELHFLSDPKYGKARQLWLYEYVLKRVLDESPQTILRNASHVAPQNLQPKSGILSFRNFDAGVLPSDLPFTDAPDAGKGFMETSENILADFVKRVLDPEEPIQKTRDLDVCQWCAYRGICAR